MATKKNSPAPPSLDGQISLFNVRETPDAFRKAVQVVHSQPKSPLSLLQRKLGNAWLKHAIDSQPDDEGWWQLGIGQLAVTIGFDSNNRQYLRESAEALMRIVHEWDVLAPTAKRVQWKASVLFPEVEIENTLLRFQVSSQLLAQVRNPAVYAFIDESISRRFRRGPTFAIYQHCFRFVKVGKTSEVKW